MAVISEAAEYDGEGKPGMVTAALPDQADERACRHGVVPGLMDIEEGRKISRVDGKKGISC
jgi:hypothetical protein